MTGPRLLFAAAIAVVGIMVVLWATAVVGRLDKIIETQAAVRANQQQTVFPQHEAILSAIREKCR
jgi:hypothetical protein